jgi:hypothetical protein
MKASIYRYRRWVHITVMVAAGVLLTLSIFLIRKAFPDKAKPGLLWLAAGQVLAVVTFGVLHTLRIANQYVQSFYDLVPSEAKQLIRQSYFGLRSLPPPDPALGVRDGQVSPDGPDVLRKIGGPGNLGVGHNNAAVTQRFGKLDRIWGPSFGPLEPWERVWDVVDIRPQHRTLRVDFMTRDGIPAYCDAEMTFRVASAFNPDVEDGWASARLRRRPSPDQPAKVGGGASEPDPYGYGSGDERWAAIALKPRRASGRDEESEEAQNGRDKSYPYSEDAILNLVRNKYVTSSTDPQAVSDWSIGITRGALDGAIRDELEKYWLDQFWDPIDTFAEDDVEVFEPRSLVLEREKMKLVKKPLHELRAAIAREVRETGRGRGVQIDNVELTELKPDDRAISRQWLETWRARVQKELDLYHTQSRLARLQAKESIRVDVKAKLIMQVLDRLEEISGGGRLTELSSGLIITEFLGVLESMCRQGPEMQRLAFQQSESLIRVINAIQRGDSPFGSTFGPWGMGPVRSLSGNDETGR